MNSATPLRYPGGKSRLTGFIKLIFEENNLLDGHYVEPYAGGAGVAINLLLLDYASRIHINDLDLSIYAFWHSVLNSTDAFCKRIKDAKVTIQEWKKQKAIQQFPESHCLLDLGFSTFFLNRTNRSGIITGGVIGGNNQTGDWKMDARFNKVELCRRIEHIALFESRIRLHNLNASDLIKTLVPSLPSKSFIYLDPPYYSKADRLYKNVYKHQDHAEIAKLVRTKIGVPWVVSYDNVPEIATLYRGFPKIVYGMPYSAAESYKGSEVMFFSKNIKIPKTRNSSILKAA